MKKIKVLTVFGTRPEAIKMAPLVKELENNTYFESIVCVTAQHREMLDQVLEVFKIKPDYDLDIMKEKQSLEEVTSRVLTHLNKVVIKEKPDLVLVHGDTTTTLAGSLCAFYNKIKIGHVESGLRTYNKYSPFPEEINRILTDQLADIYFAPTEISKANLLKEGIKEENIFVTGNTAIDALKTTIKSDYNDELLEKIDSNKILLLTAHRRENIGDNMVNIFNAIKNIVHESNDIEVIYPMHKNPEVREIASEIFKYEDRIHLIEPLDVLDFHNYLDKAYIILTDSGGIQEEAPSLGKPVLVLRDTTERPEGVIEGTLKLTGTEEVDIYNSIKELLINKELYDYMSNASNPYGDGNASKYIVEGILKYFNIKY